MATEASCWGPILQASRCVLAGDHQQLPPTIKCDAAAAGGLKRTLFERLLDSHGEAVGRMLQIQYR